MVTAAVAALASARGEKVAVVKPAQTGVAAGEPGDLDEVARLAGTGDTHELAALLGIRPGSRVLRIHRLRLADGEPMSVDASHLPARRFPGLRRSLERHPSLYEALSTDYGVEIAEAQETIETGLADPRDARLLGVDVGMPLLLLSRQAFDQTGTPVEWAQSRYRGDRYKLVTRLHRGGTRVPRTGE